MKETSDTIVKDRQKAISEVMRMLGQTKSEKKRIASINNGKKGGKNKKQQLTKERD